jgi:hypothetical protein
MVVMISGEHGIWYDCGLSNEVRTADFFVHAPDKDVALSRLLGFALEDPANAHLGFHATPVDELFDPVVVEADPADQLFLSRARRGLGATVIPWAIREAAPHTTPYKLYTAAPPNDNWPLRK